MSERKGDWCQTFTGRQFWPLDPRPEDIDIEDIAHALSMLCRFGGHCERFISVAEHSVRVSWLCGGNGSNAQMQGLLHDAAEAYLVDLPRPIKRHMPQYRDAEALIFLCIAGRFGIDPALDPKVKWADEVMLATEARWFMKRPPNAWAAMPDPLDRFEPWTQVEAYDEFRRAFKSLGGMP